MKKLVICSNESIVGGLFNTGVGEVSDSLAIELSKDYEVTVVCPDGNGRIANLTKDLSELFEGVRGCTLMNVRFLLTRNKSFMPKAIEFASPDVLLNFGDIELIDKLISRPSRVVCALDLVVGVEDKLESLEKYDAIVTVSQGYANMLLSRRDALSELLQTKEFRGVTNGVLTDVLSPENGIMLPSKYSTFFMSGKIACKRRLCEQYGLPYDRYIAVMMGRLIDEKGVDGVIDHISDIYASGGYTVIVGSGKQEYMDQLDKLKRSDGVLWLKNKISPLAMIPMLAGADFLLYPSRIEACGLMPMTACRYGTIPVTTLNGGLADNMNENIAIIIDNMDGAADLMKNLYNDKTTLMAKRKKAMSADFSWATRKQGYLEVLQ